MLSAVAALTPLTLSVIGGALPRTAAIIGLEMACGDAIEQRLERHPWEAQRTLRLGLTGLGITGPLAHMLFTQLECKWPGAAMRAVALKVTGNAAFMPIMIAATLSSAWALEGRTFAQISHSLRHELAPAIGAGLLFWPLVNGFIFLRVPPPMRPAISSGFGGLWGVYLSARANSEGGATC